MQTNNAKKKEKRNEIPRKIYCSNKTHTIFLCFRIRVVLTYLFYLRKITDVSVNSSYRDENVCAMNQQFFINCQFFFRSFFINHILHSRLLFSNGINFSPSQIFRSELLTSNHVLPLFLETLSRSVCSASYT